MIRKIKWWIGMFILLSVSIYACSLAFVYSYSFKDHTQKADVAIVLGAAAWVDKPSPVFKNRIDHGIWLYKEGYVHSLLFTGGQYNSTSPSEASVAKNYAIKHGVKKEDIYIEENSKTTEENIQNAKEIVKHKNIADALIVSDPMHMSRAITIASFNGIKSYASPTPHSAFQSWDTKLPFLSHEALYLSGYVLTYPFRFVNAYILTEHQLLEMLK